jgi:hypothetical protein
VGWLADFVIAALRVPHDPPGFPAVQFLLAALVGQRVADDPGEQERQRRPGGSVRLPARGSSVTWR